MPSYTDETSVTDKSFSVNWQTADDVCTIGRPTVQDWYFTFDHNGAVKFYIGDQKPPNRFNRLMQRLLLGIYWKRKDA